MKPRLVHCKTAARIASLAVLAGVATALPANAETIGFQLELSGSNNVPTFGLTNTSDTALIEAFEFTIGDITRNFDAVTGLGDEPGKGVTPVLNSPDSNDGGGVRSDILDIGFNGFLPGILADFFVDVDRDSSNTVENFQTVFFNNGDAMNSIASVLFSTGDRLDLTLTDELAQSPFIFTASSDGNQEPPPIPVPAGVWLFLGGLLGLTGVARGRAL